MAPGGGLQVVLRVEVAVDENDGVSGGQVQADSACKTAQCLYVSRRMLLYFWLTSAAA